MVFWRERLVILSVVLFLSESSRFFSFRECKGRECSIWYQPRCTKKTFTADEPLFVCYTGRNQFSIEAFLYAWTDTVLTVTSNDKEFTIKKDSNYTAVREALKSSMMDYLPSLVDLVHPHDGTRISLSTFQPECVGIRYDGQERIPAEVCVVEKVHWRFPVLLVIGMALFLLAPRLCQSITLQYSSGTAIGILASLLILIYIISKMVPGKKFGAYAVLALGWSTVAYFLSLVWGSFRTIVVDHWQAVLGYVTVSGLISFGFCYWRGPITSPRSLSIIQWSLQCVALTMLYCSFQCEVLSLPLIIVGLLIYNCPQSLKNWIRFRWYLWFPPRRRLLTSEEYKKQGEEETAKALTELKEFCRSSSSSWDMVSRLRNPKRFTKFLRGDHHIPTTDIQEYNRVYSGASDVSSEELSFVNSLPSYQSASSSFLESSSSDDDSR